MNIRKSSDSLNSFIKLCLCLLTATLLINASVAYSQREDLLTFGITGSESGNYSAAMSQPAVQKLLLEIAATPRPADYLDSALRETKTSRQDLENLGLIRKQGENYLINFMLLTTADVDKLNKVSEIYAASMSEAFLKRRSEIESVLSQYQVKEVDSKAVAYIILGCFSLDWDGLDITAEKGYRSVAMARANGDKYIPWANQKGQTEQKAMFKGSHNRYLPEVVITSFGDHFTLPRYALPDLLLQLPNRALQNNMPLSLRKNLAAVVQQAVDETLGKAGQIIFDLREGEKSLDELAKDGKMSKEELNKLLTLLTELDYIGQKDNLYSTKIPVFTKRDNPLVQKLRRLGREVMEEWLMANYERSKADLADITPFRHGVSYKEGFTEIWHYFFGITNRQLVKAGLFADPYLENRKYKGFIPVIWHPSLTGSKP